MTAACLRAIGTAHPAHCLERSEWLKTVDRIAPRSVDRALLARIAKHSGIESRWCACPDAGFYPEGADDGVPGTSRRMDIWLEAARAMAVQACAGALNQAGTSSTAVTHCITASCTGFRSPGIDASLIEVLNLPRSCRRLNIGFMGCHAAVNALATARSIVRSDPRAVVLVCCVEVCSAHFHRSTRLDQLIANTLFGDGAAATIVSAENDGANSLCPVIVDTHSILIADTAQDMTWTVGDHGFEMTLSARVPEILCATVGKWTRDVLASHGLDVADINAWAIHPGGPRVIDAVIDSLGLLPQAGDVSRSVFRDHGNMSSCTLLFICERFLRCETPRPWVALAFGPGLVGEMALLG